MGRLVTDGVKQWEAFDATVGVVAVLNPLGDQLDVGDWLRSSRVGRLFARELSAPMQPTPVIVAKLTISLSSFFSCA